MIKIKSKIIGENQNDFDIGVDYSFKNTNVYEHLVIINLLINKILEHNKELTKNELLKIIVKNAK